MRASVEALVVPIKRRVAWQWPPFRHLDPTFRRLNHLGNHAAELAEPV